MNHLHTMTQNQSDTIPVYSNSRQSLAKEMDAFKFPATMPLTPISQPGTPGRLHHTPVMPVQPIPPDTPPPTLLHKGQVELPHSTLESNVTRNGSLLSLLPSITDQDLYQAQTSNRSHISHTSHITHTSNALGFVPGPQAVHPDQSHVQQDIAHPTHHQASYLPFNPHYPAGTLGELANAAQTHQQSRMSSSNPCQSHSEQTTALVDIARDRYDMNRRQQPEQMRYRHLPGYGQGYVQMNPPLLGPSNAGGFSTQTSAERFSQAAQTEQSGLSNGFSSHGLAFASIEREPTFQPSSFETPSSQARQSYQNEQARYSQSTPNHDPAFQTPPSIDQIRSMNTRTQHQQNILRQMEILHQQLTTTGSTNTMSPIDIYERGINPREAHGPDHPAVPPLPRMPAFNQIPMDHPLAPATYNLPSLAAQAEQIQASQAPLGDEARVCACAWKACSESILREYALLKKYQLGLRALMRQSSEVFYNDLSKWMLELPPQTRVKDVFYRNTSERDPLTGQLIQSSTPITPLTIILEQYRDMDKKIVEYHLRNEKALGEFDQELRSSLENGLKGLMDVEAMGLVPQTESRHPNQPTNAVAPSPVQITGSNLSVHYVQQHQGTDIYVDSNGKVLSASRTPKLSRQAGTCSDSLSQTFTINDITLGNDDKPTGAQNCIPDNDHPSANQEDHESGEDSQHQSNPPASQYRVPASPAQPNLHLSSSPINSGRGKSAKRALQETFESSEPVRKMKGKKSISKSRKKTS